jgi:hypothetical protein
VDDKTGGRFNAQIDTGAEKAKDALDALDGKNDDIADATAEEAPPATQPQP